MFTVKAKVVALAVGVSLASLIAASASFVVYDRASFAQSKQDTLEVLAASLSGSASGPAAFRDVQSTEYVLRTVDAERTARWAAVYTDDGVLATWRRSRASVVPTSAGALRNGYVDGRLRLVVPIASEGGRVGTLAMEFGTEDLEARTRRFVGIAFAVMVVASLLGAFVAFRLQRRITAPVFELERTALVVRDTRNFAVRAARLSNDELGTLTDVFNGMIQGIEERDRELETHRTQLEDLVARRTQELDRRNGAMRLVLDNVEQGFLTIDAQGKLAAESSAIVAKWFPSAPRDSDIGQFLDAVSPGTGALWTCAWSQVTDDVLPIELAFDQLPKGFTLDKRTFRIDARPLLEGTVLTGALLVVSDVTESTLRALQERLQREFAAAVERAMDDRTGFRAFIDEMTRLVEDAQDPAAPNFARTLHTIKGNAALFGRDGMTADCHELEEELRSEGTVPVERLRALRDDWTAFVSRISSVLGEGKSGDKRVEIPASELQAIVQLIEKGTPPARVATRLRDWLLDPVAPRLKTFAREAVAIAPRLGRAQPEVVVKDGGVRVDGEIWAPLWASLSHVVRNSLDHGIEPADERTAAGKPEAGRLEFSASLLDANTVELLVKDDGRGVDWERVRGKARSMGLPHATQRDLEDALFSDGLSTRDVASLSSGRGIGMGAFRAAVLALGGSLELKSIPGNGVQIRALVPVAAASTPRLHVTNRAATR